MNNDRNLETEWNDYVGFAMTAWREIKRSKSIEKFERMCMFAEQVIPCVMSAVEVALEMDDKFYHEATLTLLRATKFNSPGEVDEVDDAMQRFASEYEK